MKALVLAAVAGAALSFASAGAEASPIASGAISSNPLVSHAAQGCGPGMFRGPAGYCRPMGGGGMGYGRGMGYGGPGYGPRRCFVRPTPYGPRRICR